MAIIYQDNNNIWRKKKTADEKLQELKIEESYLHAQDQAKVSHDLESISASDYPYPSEPKNLKDEIGQIYAQISDIKGTNVEDFVNTDLFQLKCQMLELQKELFYQTLLAQNLEYSSIFYDAFKDDSKMESGNMEIINGQCQAHKNPEANMEYIYDSVRFMPHMDNDIEGFVFHADYDFSTEGFLEIKISFDDGQSYMTVFNTKPSSSYYYNATSFLDMDSAVSTECNNIIRVQIVIGTGENKNSPIVKSYGILVR